MVMHLYGTGDFKEHYLIQQVQIHSSLVIKNQLIHTWPQQRLAWTVEPGDELRFENNESQTYTS